MSILKMPKNRPTKAAGGKRLFAWVPKKLHASLKIEAIKQGKTLEDFACEILEKWNEAKHA